MHYLVIVHLLMLSWQTLELYKQTEEQLCEMENIASACTATFCQFPLLVLLVS